MLFDITCNETAFPGFLAFHATNLPPPCWLMGPVFGLRSRSCCATDPHIFDPHVVRPGRKVVIAFNTGVAAHCQQRDAVVIKRTSTEDDVVVGGYCVIYGGVGILSGEVIGSAHGHLMESSKRALPREDHSFYTAGLSGPSGRGLLGVSTKRRAERSMLGKRGLIAIAVLVAWVLPLASCAKKPEAKDPGPRRNVLLIIVDAVRVDRLGCYGSELGATPRIDELAASGVRFANAYSHASWTLPACASILTSLYPPQHGAGGNVRHFRKLPDSVRTVAECFRDAGYATAAVVNVDFLTASFGMTQGFTDVDFEVYPNNIQARPAKPTTDAALAWLKSHGDQPFFLLVHYFDPHLVYAPPPEYRQRFAAPEDRSDAGWVFGTRRQIVAYRQGLLVFDEPTIRRAERLYNGEVAYTDHEVGRLLDGLELLGLTESTIVVLTADHGEEFLDHGGFEHGHTLYNELVRVPLLVRVGRGGRGRSVASVVAHVDLAPTLCELTGVALEPTFVGRSLAGLLTGAATEDHPVIFEGNFWGKPLQGWLQGGYKLIRRADGTPELFNLTRDPYEEHDLRDTDPERVKRMSEDLDLAYRGMLSHMEGKDLSVELSPEERRRLEALGYVGDQ